MTGFEVDASTLGSFGWAIGAQSEDADLIAPYCRRYAGNTTGMSGLLELLQPLVDGSSDTSVTGAFARHYDSLASIIKGTGEGVQNTATTYSEAERTNLLTLDKQATIVPGGTDSAYTGKYQLGWTGIALGTTAPQSDPMKPVRADMDIDVKGIDWLFHKATGHHITEPIDMLVGNWTTLWADGAAWDQISQGWTQIGQNLTAFCGQIDHIWDGQAEKSFQAYMSRLDDAIKGEADLAAGVAKVLGLLADKFQDLATQAVDMMQSVIHQVESAAIWLASLWWCGVGEAAAVEKAGEALEDFQKTWKLVNRLIQLVKYAQKAMMEYYRFKAIIEKVVSVPSEISGKISELQNDLKLAGAAPGILDDLSHLPQEPTRGYGGPRDPGV